MASFGRFIERTVVQRVPCQLYDAWTNMRRRCASELPAYFKWYKAKGITVCAEWDDYGTFRAWALANGFRKGLTLDRKDGNGNYEPNNCRWATRVEQQNNTSHCIRMTLNGVTHTLPEWSRITGISKELLRVRHREGWTDEQVLTTPKLATGYARPGVQHKPRGRAAQKAKRLAQLQEQP
jgi:hypothetical protein